ncbi:abnormal spindle-like microcephaly-associated protein homolog [Acanthaster planci]|uniref:Abnormal spindle-like microcephaly-associated protein homolog n=1 Tax=Acanthaster planci TaxID=133434 RepID=A0A8B7YMX4_ACAPL|nr:abnormal spindle-like microcephaly-associated protein homolog [Acanthaster planci]XP_022094619.1 abnormal spindle-like microcephaly-associated protein homolog [Acanthaster planci]XP_022094620.1 abnormal spindle-like microcephaly-associated protein homolog [Acanthaster planci]
MDNHESRSPLAVNPWPMDDRDTTPRKSRGGWFSGTPHKVPPPEFQRGEEEEDLPVLKLTHFTKKVMVCFDTVRTGATRTRELLVENPFEFPQELRLEKFPFNKGFSIPEKCWELDGCELMRLPITWTPKEEGNAREMVTFKCEGAFRLQVILLGTAEDPPKKRGAGRRSTFSVHRKAPLRVTQPQAVLKPSRPTMILKPKVMVEKPQVPGGKRPQPSNGRASKENQENRAPIKQSDSCKSARRLAAQVEVGDADEPQMDLSTPSSVDIYEGSPLEEFTALDTSLAEINGAGMPVTAQDLLLENLKRQTLSVCSGMSPLLQTAKPFTLPKPTLADTHISQNAGPSVGNGVQECITELDEEEPCSGPKRLSIEAKTTVTKNKAPDTRQPSKPADIRKNLFLFAEAEGSCSSKQMSSPSEFEDSLNEPQFTAVPCDPCVFGKGITEQCVDAPKEVPPVPHCAEKSQDTKMCANTEIKGTCILMADIPLKSDMSQSAGETSLDSMTPENIPVSPPLRCDNSAQLGADDFKVHSSVVTSHLISRKRVSDPKDEAGSPPKKLKAQEVKSRGEKKPPPRDRTTNRTLALRRAAAAEKSGKTAKARAQGRPTGQYKAKGPMKGVPMAKLNLLKPSGTGIPRHPMPFAAKNMFYDERWMEKQERGFTRWLNHVLTPEDCPKDPSCKATKIDAGTLCVEPMGKAANVALAPSKEDLSLRAYTAKRKLNRLRRGACMLFQSEPIVRVIQKLEAEIEKRRIEVRPDRKLHADYGIKQRLLDLFLSYNPLWLRIGLETVYGEILPLQGNTDMVGLSRFIITRLLGNPDIATQFAHPTVPHLYGPGYEEALSQFTLKKFLVLVFFLDRAKLTRLIDHDPCLFCKDSEFKSSRDILLHFSREYLRGEGDLTRHLSFMGYSVTHRQTALDEFDFSVTKLATDLRCGVRLARVVELLIHDWTLSSQLRVPAISRLQKIHNVEVTLKALKLDGGGVDARAVVDGHREKTLELLWRIIFQFQIGLLLNEQQLKEEIAIHRKNLRLRKDLNALATLPLTDTLMLGMGDNRRDSNEPNMYFKSSRLSLLLKWCQVVCSFYGLKVENFTVAFSDGRALCYLVHHYHPSLLPLGLINQDTTQTQYQRQGDARDSGNDDSFDGTWSNVYSPSTGKPGERERFLANERENFRVLYDKVSELGGVPGVVKSAEMSNTIPDEKVVITYVSYLCARLLDLRTETRAARTIQVVWKAHRLRQLVKQRQAQEAAAKIIQCAVHSFLTRRRHQRLLGSIVKLQAMRRRVIACRQAEALRQAQLALRRHRAAISLQAHVRGFLARRHHKKTLKAIIIQSALRRYIARKTYLQSRWAVITLQAAVRCHQERCCFVQMREAAVILQQRFRAKRIGSKQRALYNLQRSACLTLQAAFRGYACRCGYRKKRSAVVALQARIRAHLQCVRYLQMKSAASAIQMRWRSTLHARSVREEYVSLRRAAVVVQSFYRGMVARRYAMYVRRVVKAQSLARCFLQRQRFLLQKRACIVIQKSFRGYTQKNRYELLRGATLVLQRRLRAQEKGRVQLREYKVMRGAVITLQAWARGILTRRWLAILNGSAVIIQSVWKMHRAQKGYLEMQRATLCIQKYTRSYLIGKAARCHYLQLRAAMVLIQSRCRAAMAQRKFRHLRVCCIALQSYVRMYIATKHFRAIQGAAVVIQQRFRAKVSRDHQMERYNLQRKATIALQAWARGVLARRQIAAQNDAAIQIQSTYKAYRERQNFKIVRSASACLQKYVRAYLIGKSVHTDYLKLKTAAVIIQSSYRGLLTRRNFQTQKRAALKIQAVVRMHQARSRFLRLRRAALIIQARYRAQRLAQETLIQYQIARGACITLQAGVRGHLVRRQMRKLHAAAVLIQSTYKAHVEQQMYKMLHSATICLQRHARAYLIGKSARIDYLKMKSSAIVIQSSYRGLVARRTFNSQKQAAVKIQSVVRMHQARNHYMELRWATTAIQNRYRAQKLAQATSLQYQICRGACITLQAGIRGLLVRQQIKRLDKAAVLIQKSYRAQAAQAKYQKMRNAALVLQEYWRATRLAREVREEFMSLRKAAGVLQSAFRGKLGRRIAKEHRSARVIQSYFRMHLMWQCYQRQRRAAVRIQSAARMQQARSRYGALRCAALIVQTRYRARKASEVVCRQYQVVRGACITLQAATRGFMVRQQIRKLHAAAVQIQKSYRSHLMQTQYQKLRGAALVLQMYWRATRLSRQVQRDFLALKNAAVVLQSAYRGQVGRRISSRHRSARLMQSYFRMYCQRRQYLNWKRTSVTIQSAVRMHQARRKYTKLKQVAIIIQRRYRATQLARWTYLRYHIQRGACITLQAYARGHLARQHIHRLHAAATTIQKNHAAYQTRTRYLKMKGAAKVLQKYWRATRLAREQKLMFTSLRKAATTLQSVYRGNAGRKIAREHRAARLIQSVYRMHVAFQKYSNLKAAAITIQALYRMRRDRNCYLRLVAATVTIQQFFRGHLLTRASRNAFLLARRSAVKIQAAYRGLAQQRGYNILKQAAARIQALYRGKRQRKEFLTLKWSAVVLQERYRAHVLRDQAFRAYNIQRGAAITAQAAYRAYTARKNYTRMKQAATTIQSVYRGHRQSTDFLLMRRSAAVLQMRYRAHLLMREAVQTFQAKRWAATVIQAFYRAHAERCRFINCKSAAIVIQSTCRGRKQREEYQAIRRATLVLQRRYRAHVLQTETTRNYHIQRGAVITIQAYQRGRLARQYVKWIRAAIKIQSYWRMVIQRRRYLALQNAVNKIGASFKARAARRDFLSLRHAAVTFQTRYRALIMTQAQQRKYDRICRAIITIQSFIRGRQARELTKRIRAAVKIQSAYRGYTQQRRYQSVRKCVLLLQARTRGMIARQMVSTMRKWQQAAVCIQRHFRGYAARKILEAQRQARLAQLERFSSVARFHLSAIRIQHRYRMYKMCQAAKAKMQSIRIIQRWMRATLQRLHFLKLRRSIIALQRRVRQHQALRQRAAVRIQAQARVWLARQYVRKMKAAALTVQSAWRGLHVRRSCKSKKIAAARARCIKANKAVTEEKKLCNRTASALDYLLQYRQMSGLLEALISLDVVSRLSAACCERLVEGQAVPVIFTLIRSCNRSLPCMEVIKYSVNILLNLTKYPPTAHAVFEEPESVSIILDLMQMYREKGTPIFCKVCMLLGTLAQDPRRAKIILSAPKNKERLVGIKRLTERKHSLEAKRAQAKARSLNNSCLSNTGSCNSSFLGASFLSTSALNASSLMPAPTPRKQQRPQRWVEPEWVLGRSKMREIADPLEACYFVMEALNLK